VSRTLRQGDRDPAQDLGPDPGHTVVVDPGQRQRRTAVVDPGQRQRRTAVVDPDQPRGPRVVDPGQDLRRTAADPAQDLRRTAADPAQDRHRATADPAQDRHRTAADPRQHPGNQVAVRAGSHRGRTPPDHQRPNYAATSAGQVDPIRCRVDPVLASTETSADREPPPPTSVGTSADREGLMRVPTQASTGLAQRLGTSERTSAVTARLPREHGPAPVETSAFT
jgi:hypothetical protein